MRLEVAQIRRRTLDSGVSLINTTDWCVERIFVLCKCDLDLAVDAFVMNPRPQWIAEFCGPIILVVSKDLKASTK